jgi:hypothetical protein
MLPLHLLPPYQVVFSNDEEAIILAGERILARFSGGGSEPLGHANACFFAKAATSHESLVRASQAARDYLRRISSRRPQAIPIINQLESALRLASEEPLVTPWSKLERRRSELRKTLAGFLDRPISKMSPISPEQAKLLGELEKIEILLGH